MFTVSIFVLLPARETLTNAAVYEVNGNNIVCYITISDCQTANANLDTRVSIAETVTNLLCSLTHAASIIVCYKVRRWAPVARRVFDLSDGSASSYAP